MESQRFHGFLKPFNKTLNKQPDHIRRDILVILRNGRRQILLLLLLLLPLLRRRPERVEERPLVLPQAAPVIEQPVERADGLLGDVLRYPVLVLRRLRDGVLVREPVVERQQAAHPHLEGLGAVLGGDVVPELQRAVCLELAVGVDGPVEGAERHVEVDEGEQLLAGEGPRVVGVHFVDDPEVLEVEGVVAGWDYLDEFVHSNVVAKEMDGFAFGGGLVCVVEDFVDVFFV